MVATLRSIFLFLFVVFACERIDAKPFDLKIPIPVRFDSGSPSHGTFSFDGETIRITASARTKEISPNPQMLAAIQQLIAMGNPHEDTIFRAAPLFEGKAMVNGRVTEIVISRGVVFDAYSGRDFMHIKCVFSYSPSDLANLSVVRKQKIVYLDELMPAVSSNHPLDQYAILLGGSLIPVRLIATNLRRDSVRPNSTETWAKIFVSGDRYGMSYLLEVPFGSLFPLTPNQLKALLMEKNRRLGLPKPSAHLAVLKLEKFAQIREEEMVAKVLQNPELQADLAALGEKLHAFQYYKELVGGDGFLGFYDRLSGDREMQEAFWKITMKDAIPNPGPAGKGPKVLAHGIWMLLASRVRSVVRRAIDELKSAESFTVVDMPREGSPIEVVTPEELLWRMVRKNPSADDPTNLEVFLELAEGAKSKNVRDTAGLHVLKLLIKHEVMSTQPPSFKVTLNRSLDERLWRLFVDLAIDPDGIAPANWLLEAILISPTPRIQDIERLFALLSAAPNPYFKKPSLSIVNAIHSYFSHRHLNLTSEFYEKTMDSVLKYLGKKDSAQRLTTLQSIGFHHSLMRLTERQKLFLRNATGSLSSKDQAAINLLLGGVVHKDESSDSCPDRLDSFGARTGL